MARAFAAGARVLILDQPTAGVDVGAKAELYEHIRTVTGEGTRSSSSRTTSTSCCCSRTASSIMHGGRPVAVLPASTIDRETLLAVTTTGTLAEAAEATDRGAQGIGRGRPASEAMNGIVAVKNYGFEWYLQLRAVGGAGGRGDAPPRHRLGGRPEPARPPADERRRPGDARPAVRGPALPRGAAAAGSQGLRGHGGVLPARGLAGSAGPAAGRCLGSGHAALRLVRGPLPHERGLPRGAGGGHGGGRRDARAGRRLPVVHPLPRLLGAVDAGDAAGGHRRVLLLRALPGALRGGDGAPAAGRADGRSGRAIILRRAAGRVDGLEVQRHRRGDRDAGDRGTAGAARRRGAHQRRGPGSGGLRQRRQRGAGPVARRPSARWPTTSS